MSAAVFVDAAPESVAPRNPHRFGFALTFAGLLAMLLGVAAFLWGQKLSPMDMARYLWREVAGVGVGLSLALFLLGMVHSLPGRAWARGLGWAGAALSAAGVGAFGYLYPFAWNVAGRDMSPWGIVPYCAGVVLLSASAFMGLLDAYLARHGGSVSGAAASNEEPVTEEEIMRDIEEQTRKSRLSWGGMMLSEGPSLTIRTEAADVVALTGAVGRRFTLDNLETSPEVDRLLAFRGVKGARTEEMGGQADLLVELRQQRAARESSSSPSGLTTWWRRIVGR